MSINPHNLDLINRFAGVIREGKRQQDIAERENLRQKYEQTGVEDVFRRRGEFLRSKGSDMTADDLATSTEDTMFGLSKYGETGKRGMEAVKAGSDVRSKMLDKTRTPEEAYMYGTPSEKASAGEVLRMKTADKSRTPEEAYMYGTPEEKAKAAELFRLKGSATAEDKTAKRQIEGLIAEKKGLEEKFKVSPQHKNLNLDAILMGDADISEVDEQVVTDVVDEIGHKTGQKQVVKTGRKILDKDVSRWVDLVGRIEELSGKPAGSEDVQARRWARENPNDPRAKRIMEHLKTKAGF